MAVMVTPAGILMRALFDMTRPGSADPPEPERVVFGLTRGLGGESSSDTAGVAHASGCLRGMLEGSVGRFNIRLLI